jgi:hypothetical protein
MELRHPRTQAPTCLFHKHSTLPATHRPTQHSILSLRIPCLEDHRPAHGGEPAAYLDAFRPPGMVFEEQSELAPSLWTDLGRNSSLVQLQELVRRYNNYRDLLVP